MLKAEQIRKHVKSGADIENMLKVEKI